jgi:hypothetical protein
VFWNFFPIVCSLIISNTPQFFRSDRVNNTRYMGRQNKDKGSSSTERKATPGRNNSTDRRFKKQQKPKIPTESGPAPTGLTSPWHTECIRHRPWDAFLATGRVRLWKHACRVNIASPECIKSCRQKMKDGERILTDFTCSWCKRTTCCGANMMHCNECFDPDTPFSSRGSEDNFEEDFVPICKSCFEQHLAKSENAKELFEKCDHCQVAYGLTFGQEPHKNPNYKKLVAEYKESEKIELKEAGVLTR